MKIFIHQNIFMPKTPEQPPMTEKKETQFPIRITLDNPFKNPFKDPVTTKTFVIAYPTKKPCIEERYQDPEMGDRQVGEMNFKNNEEALRELTRFEEGQKEIIDRLKKELAKAETQLDRMREAREYLSKKI